MRVFVIGATGYIGTVVTNLLHAASHTVSGLARSFAAEQSLAARQIIPLAGTIAARDRVIAGATQADATLYVAAAESFAQDRLAVEAVLAAYRGTGKTLLFTSGSAVFADAGGGEPNDTIFTETMLPNQEQMRERIQIEQLVLDAHVHNVRTIVLRPPLVYGRGGSLQVPMMIEIARTTGAARYVGRGENRWSTVHVDDLADLYLLALNQSAAGELFHAASGEVRMRDLADAVGRLLNLGPAVSWSQADAQRWGSYAGGLGSNSRITGAKAQQLLGWSPSRPAVLADVEQGSYR